MLRVTGLCSEGRKRAVEEKLFFLNNRLITDDGKLGLKSERQANNSCLISRTTAKCLKLTRIPL